MSGNDSFVHLHVHTEYSMLDGAARVKPLIDAAVEQGMSAIGITDHGNNFGAFDFYKTAKAAGIKPIIGIEAYLTPGTPRQDRSRIRWGSGGEDDISGGGAFTHMTMFAENTDGMYNLFRMSSKAWLDGFYFKPRMDRELLQTYGKGIIATTGCASGEIQTRLRLGQYEEAKKAAGEFQEIFGRDNFFAEIMDHGLDIERRAMSDLLKLAKELGMPLLATNDLHYTHAGDSAAHEALLCVQSGSTLTDPNRFKFDSQEFYLKTPAQMRELFSDHPESCDNTLLVAERCNVEFKERELMPHFPVPENHTEATWFEQEVAAGMERRYRGSVPEAQAKQVIYEVEVIKQMGYPGYFLVVADFIAWARAQGIRVGPGRGSAAGSIVSYALGITELDPVKHGLIFERFLNPERVSMPDIDVDFDDRRRGEVIRYVSDKYGDDRVAQIVTFGTIKAKQALKDAGRVLAMPYAVGEKLTKAMPPMVLGRDIALGDLIDKKSDRYKEAGDFRELIENDSDSMTVFKLAQGLESLKRQWGVHAAGVIMSAEPLIDVIPIMRRDDDGAIITQFDQPPCEKLGLLKMDFLGLRNLTVLDDTIANIKLNRGIDVVLEDLDLDSDQPTFELLSRGDTLGVFQLDGSAMRSLLRLLKPTVFEHISAVIALYRPGPMGMNSHTNYALRKNGQQVVDSVHPELSDSLSEVLDPTYGLIVYQEQVMAAAQKAAGFTLGKADLLRRAMGKKDKKELDRQYQSFSEGMTSNGYSEAAVKALWDTLLPFADYAFNRAHSAAYGVLSYWTAYLKANFPAEYMAALLTSVGDSKDKLGLYLSECRRMGIQVLAPDVNQSIAEFSAVGEDIRFGLGAVRNVGLNVVEAIRKTREEKSAFSSFHDFLRKVPGIVCSKRVVESLIKAGAFDSLGHTRRSLAEISDEAVDSQASLKKNEAVGQVDLFGSMFDDALADNSFAGSVPNRPEWPKKEKLSYEREMLGLYVSDHPLAGREEQLSRYAQMTIGEVASSESLRDGESITIAGLITLVQHKVARQSGNAYASITIEDFEGEMQVMLMGKTYLQFARNLEADQLVVVRGNISQRDDGNSLRAQSIEAIEGGPETIRGPLIVKVPEAEATRQLLEELDRILRAHAGSEEVQVKLTGDSADRLFTLQPRVNITNDLTGELKVLLGASCLR
jgi:DNA polymerase-3 subunit alpha